MKSRRYDVTHTPQRASPSPVNCKLLGQKMCNCNHGIFCPDSMQHARNYNGRQVALAGVHSDAFILERLGSGQKDKGLASGRQSPEIQSTPVLSSSPPHAPCWTCVDYYVFYRQCARMEKIMIFLYVVMNMETFLACF